jgi:hypothetical protein
VLFFLVCAVSMIPWTVGLAVTLPQRYVVGTWTLTWTGFDVILIGCFSVTAWALWKQRQIALPAAIVTSVLLMCDAWFDLLTAHRGGDLLMSTVTAVFGEIPIAIVLAAISTRLLRATMRSTAGADVNAQPRSLWRAPLTPPDLESAASCNPYPYWSVSVRLPSCAPAAPAAGRMPLRHEGRYGVQLRRAPHVSAARGNAIGQSLGPSASRNGADLTRRRNSP